MKIEKKNSLFGWLIRRERGYKIYPVSYKGKNYIITITNFFERSPYKILDVDKGWIKEKNWVLQVKGYEYPKKNMFPVFNYEITEPVEFSEVAFDSKSKFNKLYIYLYCREIIDYAIKQLEKEKLAEERKKETQ